MFGTRLELISRGTGYPLKVLLDLTRELHIKVWYDGNYHEIEGSTEAQLFTDYLLSRALEEDEK